jgi:hypothetical protein
LVLYEVISLGYLWYNAIGCGLVMLLGILIEAIAPGKGKDLAV